MNEAIMGLIGVLVGSGIIVFKDIGAYWAGRKRAGRYAAVRIVCVLDQYVEKCVEVVGDNGTTQGQPAGRTEHGEEYLNAQVAPPEPPSFPDDIDWTSLNPDLMYRILALPNLALETDRYISAERDHSYPPDYAEFFQARWEGYADLGIEAYKIAEELRSEFALPKTSIGLANPDWDSASFLMGAKAEARTQKEAMYGAHAALLKGMTTQHATESRREG